MMLARKVAGLAALLALAACSVEADGTERLNLSLWQTTEEEFRWQGVVAAGNTLEVKGVNGAIRAEAATGDRVEVVAAKRGRRSDPADVRVEVVEHGRGVTICAVYPTPAGAEPNRCEPGDDSRMRVRNNDVRVEFTVSRTVNGEVAAERLRGHVSVRTVNGGVRFSTSGYGEGSTVNGSIRATLGLADWSDPLEFKTVNGSITVDFADDLNADVSARTVNGSIQTDFPITVRGTFSRRSLRGTIGTGGRRITLSSVNGSIHLRRGAA
jgi:hypothetical protein